MFKFDSNDYDSKEICGLILFSISIVMFLLMLFNPLNYSFIHIDEWYSLSLVQMSLVDGLKLTAADVHPPAYYLLVKLVIKIATMLNIKFSMIYIAKIVSAIPYFLLIVISGTKLKNKYNWLTAGIFVFALGTMSEFFFTFITLRMYSWGLFFSVLSFIYVGEILNESNIKNWILLLIFMVLGAYTHYFIAISGVLLYLCLLVYILFIKDYDEDAIINKKNEFKKWIVFAIGGILLYSPWIPVVIKQFNTPGNYWIPSISVNNVTKFITYFATNSLNEILILLALLFLIMLFVLTFIKVKDYERRDKFYLTSGIFVVVFTFLILLGFSIFLHPILLSRYLIPIIGILWLIFAIVIGRLESKKVLLLFICLILFFGASGIIETHNTSDKFYDLQIHDENFLNDMNKNDTVVIHTNGINVIMFNKFLNNTKQFSLSNRYGNQLHHSLNFKEKSFNQTDNIIKQNDGKSIYLIKNKGGKMPYLGKNKTAEKIDEICNSREVFIIN